MSDGNRADGTEAEPSTDDEDVGQARTGPDASTLAPPAVEDVSGFGVTTTLATGVLLAFAYYGVRSVDQVGLGQAVPTPFYLLALALLFVIELSRSRSFDVRGLARTVGVTAGVGTVVILAIEGGAYLWEAPGAALDEYAGVAVLAVSLVVAALGYVVYLAAVESG